MLLSMVWAILLRRPGLCGQ